MNAIIENVMENGSFFSMTSETHVRMGQQTAVGRRRHGNEEDFSPKLLFCPEGEEDMIGLEKYGLKMSQTFIPLM